MKERITLTIEKDILGRVDKTVNGQNVKNRSHAVELLLIKAFGQNKASKAIILAGGKKKRSLGKSLKELPKPMIRIKNKPILEYNIELLKKYGIKDIIICIGYKGKIIKECRRLIWRQISLIHSATRDKIFFGSIYTFCQMLEN